MNSLTRLVETEVFPALSSDRLFNFYADFDPDLDLPDGPAIRRDNLLAYLAAAPRRPELLLLAEAPGPHGCRFSGIPFTSESQIEAGLFPFKARRSSIAERPWSEYSANIVWGMLTQHFDRLLIWNTVPLHPRNPGRSLSIRTPRAAEIKKWGTLIPRVVEIAQPATVLAIGRIAERVCHRFDIPVTYVRHPSQGGANLFREGVGRYLGPGSEVRGPMSS